MDDNEDTIGKRLDTFTEQSVPVLDLYTERGNARVVSSVQQPDEVYAKVQAVMDANAATA